MPYNTWGFVRVNDKVMGNHFGGGAADSGRRERYHHGDLRRDLLQAARAEIARHGAAELSLAALARLAGVSQAAPYRHFADRRALLEAVAAEAFQSLAGGLREAIGEGQSPLEAEAALAAAYLRFGLTPAAADASALNDAAQEAFGLLRTTLAAARPSGPDQCERAVLRAWAQLHGLVMLKVDGFIVRPLAAYLD